MQRFPRPPLLVVALSTLALAGCRPAGPESFQGYVEGEFVHVGAPVGGMLVECRVRKGDTVEAGATLFTLERGAEEAALAEAGHRLAQTEARVANLKKGARPTEIEALSARIHQAQVNVELWEKELGRREQLARDAVIASTELDLVRSQRDAARAALAAVTAERATAGLGGRTDEVAAAEADRQAAAAGLARVRWAVDQKTQKSPVHGLIHNTLFRPGEYVGAGQPVVSILPATGLKIRFFVPQYRLVAFPPRTAVEVGIDGLAEPLPGTVQYVSTQPEFTPPVIYSRESRAKLVFMVEASLAPEAASRLRPGQPADVRLADPAR